MVNVTKEDLRHIIDLAGVDWKEEEFTTSNYVLLDRGIVYDTNFEFIVDLNTQIKEITNDKSKLVIGVKLTKFDIYYELTDLKVQRDERINILFVQLDTPMKTMTKKCTVSDALEREMVEKCNNLDNTEELLTMFRDYRELLKTTNSFKYLTEGSYLYNFEAIRDNEEEPTTAWTVISEEETEEEFAEHLQEYTKDKEGYPELSNVKVLRKVRVF